MKTKLLSLSAAIALGLSASIAHAEGDAAKGEKLFKRCKACHKIEDGKNGVGPHLAGISGRAVGAVEGFKYSKGMMAYAEGGTVWDDQHLDAFLAKPKAEVKGTKMSFGGFKKEGQRADIIAYLKTLK